MSGLAGSVEGYYRLHARVYDLTRWTFLFGRDEAVRSGAAGLQGRAVRALEVGCGTGRNLLRLARTLPEARLTGLDLSADMLGVASRRLKGSLGGRAGLVNRRYDRPLDPGSFDLVLFSYALSMFNPGWDTALSCAAKDLAPGGRIAVVDFHDSPLPAFRRWMAANHVRMDGHLLPALSSAFEPLRTEIRPACASLWRRFLFVGRKA